MKSLLLLLLLPLALFAQTPPALLVNPFIGTGGHGHTFPGATTPFGMVQLSPDTRIDGSWDGCGGYHYSDSIIYGFSHTHLSGTGVSDYGDIMLMPMPYGKASADKKEYSSSFSHNNENAGAGWYEVYLDKNKVKAELTASTRVGFHRYTFENNEAALVLDLEHRDRILAASVEQIDDYRIRGYRNSFAWATNQWVYFEMVFSEKISAINKSSNIEDGDQNAIIYFSNMSSNQLEVKVGISFTSLEGAKRNLISESTDISFDTAKENAIETWNQELYRIKIQGGTDREHHIFYSALYHTMLQPNTANDVDGRYRGMDQKIHTADGFTYYTVFSLWDTFRAAHPLYNILYPERTRDFIKTFLKMYEQGGRLPVWELCANETDCMIGYHSVSVIADAYAKGIRDFDTDLALEAMQKSAGWNHLGLPEYTEFGQLMIDDESESISKTLEYAYDDWCIATFAEALGKKDIANEFFKRSQSWKNIFDPQTGFMRPKKNGAWLEPFEPREVNNHFTEANSWQYSFFVPHDIHGLASKHGGRGALVRKLDELFSTTSQTTGRDQSDITGLIGQYAHGNEPSHHMAWMYNELGEPRKAQDRIYQILNQLYDNSPEGLSGNEDCGQMSAWYVLSSMGFYPLCPGVPSYSLIQPIFDYIEINPEVGKTFFIKNPQNNKEEYLSTRNGKPDFWFHHSDIVQGKTIALTNSATELEFPEKEESPFKLYNFEPVIPAPVFSTGDRTFRNSLEVSILSLEPHCKIYYTLNGEIPSEKANKFIGVITITNDASLRAIAINEAGVKSSAARANYHLISHDWSIDIKTTYSPQYSAGGDGGIIDGLNADVDWRKGGWQGYQGQDFECIIDMKEQRSFSSVSASFLQDTRAWILFPTKVEVWYSTDGSSWSMLGSDSIQVPANDYEMQTALTNVNSGAWDGKPEPMFIVMPQMARFIKVKATNFGKLPEWHLGAGGDAYIFIDEIRVD